jgi:hypothetical protein
MSQCAPSTAIICLKKGMSNHNEILILLMYINSKIQLKFLKREGGFKMATKAQKQTE